MNKNFHEWYLEVCPNPNEGQTEKRIACMENFAKTATVEDIKFLLKLYNKLSVDPEQLDNFVELFSKEDPSFSKKNEEERTLLAGAALLEIVENSGVYDIGELLAISSSFAYEQVPFPEIMDAVRRVFDDDRRSLRENSDKQNRPTLSVAGLPELKEYIEENEWEADAPTKLLQVLDSVQSGLQAIEKRIAEQEGQQSIYKEDSQLLWWMLSEWSNSLGCSLKSLGKVEGSIVIGYEAAQFVTNYPGPYAMEGVLGKLISLCKGAQKKTAFPDSVMQIPPILREKILKIAKNSPILECLPLCNGIVCSHNAEKAEEWYPKFRREFFEIENDNFTPYQYAWQMYLEVLALRCYENCYK